MPAGRKRGGGGDPDTGITPKATDGEPNGVDAEQRQADDELAQRKALKEAREREEEAQMAGNGSKRGRAVDAQDAAPPEEDDGQLFVYEAGQKVSLGTLIPRGVPVEHAFVFSQARRKGAGALIPFDEDVLLVIRGKVSSVKPVAKRDDEERVKSVTIETLVDTKVVVQADSEQAMGLLAAVLAKRGIKAA